MHFQNTSLVFFKFEVATSTVYYHYFFNVYWFDILYLGLGISSLVLLASTILVTVFKVPPKTFSTVIYGVPENATETELTVRSTLFFAFGGIS